MKDQKELNRGMSRDVVLYLVAKIIEGLIGFVALSVYTKIFIPEAFGRYNTVNITVMTASLVFLGWLLQSVIRFVNEFQQKDNLAGFYSSAFFAWASVNGAALVLGSLAILLLQPFLGGELKLLAWLGLGMFITWNTSQILLSLLAALRRIKLNLTLLVFAISAKLLLLMLLTELFGAKVSLLLLSNLIIDAVVAITIVLRLKIYQSIRRSRVSKEIITRFYNYGVPLLGIALASSTLNISDRYLILYFLGASEVGIYSANYSLASAAFTMILTAVMRGVYPIILKTWKGDNREETEAVLSQGVRYFLLISVPAFIGMAMLSKWMAALILEKSYVEGFEVIYWVALAMVFLGLTEYSNKAWELKANTGVILKNSLYSALLNVGLNLFMIPIWGYKAAAINTTIAYLVYFLLSYWGGRKHLKWTLPGKTYLRIGLSSGVMALSLGIYISWAALSWFSLLGAVVMGAVVYIAVLLVTKEIQQEATALMAIINRRRAT